MRLVLKGFPPSVNTMMMPGGRGITTHKDWRRWVDEAAVLFRQQFGQREPFTRDIRVRIGLIGFSYRGDIDNVVKGAVDALEKSGIISNDNRVEKITIERRPKDKSGLRTVFYVTGLTGEDHE